MSIVFTCRHCNRVLGKLDQKVVSTTSLGLSGLTSSEQKEMIKYHNNGQVSVYTICESCEVSLEQHPHYHEQDYFIH